MTVPMHVILAGLIVAEGALRAAGASNAVVSIRDRSTVSPRLLRRLSLILPGGWRNR